MISFSSSGYYAGDRWKNILGTLWCSEPNSWSLWTRSLKAHQTPKSSPGQGQKGQQSSQRCFHKGINPQQGEGWDMFCFALNRSSTWTPCCRSLACVYVLGGLGGGRAAGPASDSGTDAVHEWEHSLPFSSPASLSLRVWSCAAAPSQARRKRLPLSSFPSTPVSL